MQKLNRWHVLIIGILLLGGLGAGGFFGLLKPKTEEITGLEKKVQECDDVIAKRSTHEANLKEYTAKLAEDLARLDEYKQRYVSIRFELTDRPAQYATLVAVWAEMRERLGPAFAKFVPEVSGCEFSGVQIPEPPTEISQMTLPASGFLRVPPSGAITLTVNGRIEDVQKLLRSLHTFSRLVTVGPPKISGQSPTLTAAIPIAFYVIADLPEGLLAGPSAADLSGSAATAGGGGMMGGGSEPEVGAGPGMGPGMGSGGEGGPTPAADAGESDSAKGSSAKDEE